MSALVSRAEGVSSSVRGTVLFVDDELLFRMVAREVVAARLPEVTFIEAADGEEALSILEHRAVDVLVTDLAMPRVGGAGLLVELVNRDLRLPVVVVSAHAAESTAVRGVPRRLVKPVDLRLMCESIETILLRDEVATDAIPALTGLVQVLAWERRTCRLRVTMVSPRQGEEGDLAMERGDIVHAAVTHDRDVVAAGIDAVLDILSVEAGGVSVCIEDVAPQASHAAIGVPLRQLLAQAEIRRRARAKAREGGEHER